MHVSLNARQRHPLSEHARRAGRGSHMHGMTEVTNPPRTWPGQMSHNIRILRVCVRREWCQCDCERRCQTALRRCHRFRW
eukprot:3721954-Prymnesium_polylepis.1